MPSDSWANDWINGDIVAASEYRKSMGCVADSTLGAPAASFDFTGLPTTYAHLLIVILGRSDTAATFTTLGLRFNNDTTANYDSIRVEDATASTATAVEVLASTSMTVGRMSAASATAGYPSVTEIWVPNYAGTVFNKQVVSENFTQLAATTNNLYIGTHGGSWRGTAAVNRVTLLPAAGYFITGSRCSIYVMGS